MIDLLTSPELMALYRELGSAILVGIVGIVFTAWGAYQARAAKLSGDASKVLIEEKHMRVLHQVAATWAENAVKDGVQDATAEALEDLKAYAEKSAPGAMMVLKPGLAVLRRIGRSYLAKAQRTAA